MLQEYQIKHVRRHCHAQRQTRNTFCMMLDQHTNAHWKNCVSTCSLLPNQVIDAVLRRHGVGCMLDWVETDLILKEKTTNIQVT